MKYINTIKTIAAKGIYNKMDMLNLTSTYLALTYCSNRYISGLFWGKTQENDYTSQQMQLCRRAWETNNVFNYN